MIRRFRRSALIESAGFLSAAIICNLLWAPQDPAFRLLHPHPYLIGIALIAVWYGAREGLAAALLSVAVLLAQPAVFSDASSGARVSDALIWTHVAWFLGTGLVLGAVRQFHLRHLGDLSHRLERTHQELLRHQALEARRAEEASDRLREMSEQTNALRSLYESLSLVERGQSFSAHYAALLRIMTAFSGARRGSFWLAEGGGERLRLTGAHGWSLPEFPAELPVSPQGMVGLAVAQRRVVALHDLPQLPAPDLFEAAVGHPIAMCAPLYVEGELAGLVTLEDMPVERSSLAIIHAIGLMVELAGAMIGATLAHRRHLATEFRKNEATTLFQFPYAAQRFSEECARARRYRVPVSLLAASWQGWPNLPQESPDRRERIIREIAQALRDHTRGADLIAHDERPGHFLVVMPHTDLPGAMVCAERLQRRLASCTEPCSVSGKWFLGVGSLHEEEEAASLVERVRTALEDVATGTAQQSIALAA